MITRKRILYSNGKQIQKEAAGNKEIAAKKRKKRKKFNCLLINSSEVF
jgi:hypothetical protein